MTLDKKEEHIKRLPVAGEIFGVQEHEAFLMLPPNTTAGNPIPWAWYAPTLPKLPAIEEKWMFDKILAGGIAIAGVDVGEQPLERRPLDVGAGEAAIIVAVGQRLPALAAHGADVELRRLSLGVESVEVGLEALAGGLARVDGAADAPWLLGLGAVLRVSAHPFPPAVVERFLRVVSPAQRKPFQLVPVTSRAMVERLV